MAPGEVAEWLNAPHSKCGIGASLSGVRIPPSPPPIFGSEKVLQNQALLEPPGFGGGAPRWSTAAALLWHFPARFATRKFASLTSGDIAELLSRESSPSGHGRI